MKRHLTGMNFRLTGMNFRLTVYEPPSTGLVVAMPGCEAPSTGHERERERMRVFKVSTAIARPA